MKKIIVLTALVLLCLSVNISAKGAGSGFGAMMTASTQGMGSGNFTLGVGLADYTSFIGGFTYGLSANTDGRLRLALVDADYSDTKLAFAADFNYNIISVGELHNGPFDMAFGGSIEFYDYDFASVTFLGAHYVGSYPFVMSNKSTLTPYGRFTARIEMINYDAPLPGGDDSESNLEFGLNAGVKWQVSNTLNMFGEFQFDGNDGIFLGIEFNAM